MKNESGLYPEIGKAFRQKTEAVFKIPGSPYNEGLPDFVIVWGGWAIHMEVKLDRLRDGKLVESLPTALQREHLHKVNLSGGIGFVLTFQPDKTWGIRHAPTWDVDPNFVAPRNKLVELVNQYVLFARGVSIL